MIARVHTSRYLYSPLRFNGQVYKTAYNNKNSQSQKATNTRVGIIRAYVATFPTATRAAAAIKATRAVHLLPRRFGRNRNRRSALSLRAFSQPAMNPGEADAAQFGGKVVRIF